MTLFEESLHVPLIVAAPGFKRGVSSPALVELVDVYPTLAELAGLRPPENLEGCSLTPLLRDPERAWKSAVFSIVARRRDGQAANSDADPSGLEYVGRSVRTQRWRYTQWPNGATELYDLEQDPRQYVNLANAAVATGARDAMTKVLTAGWQAALPKMASQ
jgi:arylsulfatase A-like enzyme